MKEGYTWILGVFQNVKTQTQDLQGQMLILRIITSLMYVILNVSYQLTNVECIYTRKITSFMCDIKLK